MVTNKKVWILVLDKKELDQEYYLLEKLITGLKLY